ncbi:MULTISPECIES: hypothetical protein [Trichocoleus]|uniref:Uncharacterized protein n=1 Tax=Trichocoleus desertorum GB2-A4 TaxID=2933944 RepID=A0ABV0JBQ7_9CYAN|nr:hypothetical protein [Trichocoleus sp. FACHB-46]MBD1865352.1 hypothetical protein [Trichocoleus sp. FACHB-46]
MKSQWQNYRDLELIANPRSQQQPQHLPFSDRLDRIWRSLIDAGIKAFSEQQQTEHLDRCWSLAAPQGQPTNPFNICRLLWLNIRQVLTNSRITSEEPEIQEISDRDGSYGWSVINPRTGQKTYLQSEDEVRVWLEERFYR